MCIRDRENTDASGLKVTLSVPNVNTALLTGVALNFFPGVMKVRAGGEHADALMTNGTVTAWGKIWNGSGYVAENLPAGLTGVTDISAGAYHTLAIGSTPLVILTQPVSQIETAGATATFFVGASGATTYQWQKYAPNLNNYWSNINGATSATLILTNVQASDLAQYRVVVGNSAGSVISMPATLSGYGGSTFAPVIVTQPVSAVVYVGGTATFVVDATGASSYQWYKGSTPITGATSPTLSLPNAQQGNEGTYYVIVSNNTGAASADGRVTSNLVYLTVLPIVPHITLQPTVYPPVAKLGDTVTFTVRAEGTAPLIYQWMKNGTPVPAATTDTLILTNVQPSDADTYTVVVTNNGGRVTSNAVTLVMVSTPAITSQPLSYTAYQVVAAASIFPNPGSTPKRVTLAAKNVGIVVGSMVTGPAGTVGAGATVVSKDSSGLILTLSVPNANAGPGPILAPLTFMPVHSFDVKAVGGFISQGIDAVANIPVNPTGTASTVTLAAPNADIVPGTKVTGPAGTVGKNATVVSKDITGLILSLSVRNAVNAAASTVHLTFISAAEVVVGASIPANPDGIVSTVTLAAPNAAIVPGVLVLGPVGTVGIGARVVSTDITGLIVALSVPNAVNSNLGPVTAQLTFASYQWKKNGIVLVNGTNAAGTVISGVNSEVLTLTNIHTSDAGSYSLVVTNILGTATSKVATLKVVPINQILTPAITSSLEPLTLTKGLAIVPYQITVNTNTPMSYAAKGLPNGLVCSSTGLISGKPTKSGTYLVTLQAKSKSGGLASATMYRYVSP